MIIEDSLDVRQFGAYGDSEHDDTNSLQKALNYKCNTINCIGDFYITESLIISGLWYNKKFNFSGNILFDDNFQGDYVFKIQNINQGHIEFNKIVLSHKKFYLQDKNMVTNTVRTNFGGLLIKNCRLLIFNTILVMGISSNAIRTEDISAIRASKVYLWGSNLTDENSINLNAADDLTYELDSRYTYGMVLLSNDSIIDNLIIAGFHIGIYIPDATTINAFHPWGYKSTLLYGAVVNGKYNLISNIYIDTIKSLENRTGAGIYEAKIADNIGNKTPNRNKYSNITTYGCSSDSYIFELGDDDNTSTSLRTSVVNIVGENDSEKTYKLYRGAKVNSLLENKYGIKKSFEKVSLSNLEYDASADNIYDLLFSIIKNQYGDGHDWSKYGDASYSMTFVTKEFNSLFTNGFEKDLNNSLIYTIENDSRTTYKCTIQRYGYPTSDEYIIRIFKDNNKDPVFYQYVQQHIQIVNSIPNASNYLIGSCIFYNNKPYWCSKEYQWVDSDGNLIS